MKTTRLLSTSIAMTATLAVTAGFGCSKKSSKDSGTGTTVTAGSGPVSATTDATVTAETGSLQLSGTLALLQAQDSSGTALVGFSLAADRTLRLRVNNEAFEAIDQAASILCFIAQTKFWEQANAGVYQAMIDNDKCENGGGGGGGGGSEGGGEQNGQASLSVAYVDSTREENKPLVGHFRIEAGEGEEEADRGFYHVRVIVAAAPSDEYPAGIIDMRFTQHAADGSVGQYGYINTAKNEDGQFTVAIGMAGSEGGGREHSLQGFATLEKVGDDFIGSVVSKMSGTEGNGSKSSKFDTRFDESFVNVRGKMKQSRDGQSRDEDLTGCYDRNKFKTAIFRYDLAHSDGRDVVMNSGFPAEFDKNGKTYRAHASYWGLWVEGNASVSTGDTVYKVDWANGGSKTRTAYTAFSAPGKLMKLTKATVTLAALKGVDMNYWSNGNNYIVKWNGTKLAITGKMKNGDRGQEEEAASGDVEIPQWGLGLWVQSINANVQIPYGTTLTDAYTIAYHKETVVSGTTDLPSGDLVCFQNCPVMAPTAAAFQRDNGGQNGPRVSQLYKTTTVNWGNGSQTVNQAHSIATAIGTYTFDATAQVLKEGGTAFTLPSDLPSSEGEQRNLDNVWSGALVPVATWNAISDKSIDPWRLQQEVGTYYRWSAGAQNWNKFQGLKNSSGTFVRFDKPIDISFTLTTAAEFDGMTDTNVIGKSYRLSYGGPGQLWGIPWKYSKEIGHHMPLFSLKSGTVAGDYIIYPREGEQRMAKTEAANCSALDLDALPELPEVTNSDIDVGDMGDKDSPLKYIAGVAVGEE